MAAAEEDGDEMTEGGIQTSDQESSESECAFSIAEQKEEPQLEIDVKDGTCSITFLADGRTF